MRELLPHEISETLMIQAACCRYENVPGIEESAIVVEQHCLLEPADRLLCAQNRLPQRVILPEVLSKYLVNKVVGTVLVHLDLFENHSALTDNVLSCEDRIEHQVA